jgi:hypothetical protein
MSETKAVMYEPHVLVDVVDPMKDGTSTKWKTYFYSMLAVEVVHCFLLIVIAKHSLSITKITSETTHAQINNFAYQYGNFGLDADFGNFVYGTLVVVSMLLIYKAWHTVAGDQKKLDYTIGHTKFKIRNKKGLESFSKYGTSHQSKNIFEKILNIFLKKVNFFANPRDVVMEFTGIDAIDSETGITTEKVNECTEWVDDHPYKGNTAFNVIGVPKFADSEEVIVANFLEAVSTLEPGHLVSTTMISGHNMTRYLDDVERDLKLPNLNPIREKALWSIYNKFKDRAGTDVPIFIIHIGLPPAVHRHEHIENMRRVRDEFELTLNEIGLETVLIKDPEDLSMIIRGMFTGEVVFGRDITEY